MWYALPDTALGKLSRPQSIALLQNHKPDATQTDLDTLAGALGDLAPALQLAGRCWQSYRPAAAELSFFAELQQPEPVWLQFNTNQSESAEQRLSTVINNLGRLLHDQADLIGAQQAFNLSLTLDERHFGAQHPYVARDLNKLGTVLHDLSDPDSAQQCFEQALAIDEAFFGGDHPCVARDVNNLAIVLRDSGDPASAFEAFQWALAICERTLGAEHAYTQIVRHHLAGSAY